MTGTSGSNEVIRDGTGAEQLGSGIIARYTCGCSVVRDFDGHEYQQASLLCAGGSEHERRVVNPTRENEHLWRPQLPFGED